MNTLPSYSAAGGYPLFYLGKRGRYCSVCAQKKKLTIEEAHIHWEGEPLECGTCSLLIDSAYGNEKETN